MFSIPLGESSQREIEPDGEEYCAGMCWAPFALRRGHGSPGGLGEKPHCIRGKKHFLGGRVVGAGWLRQDNKGITVIRRSSCNLFY